MEWFKIRSTLEPEFYSCAPETPEPLWTWFLLAAYCARSENDGVIKNSKSWRDREWIAVGIRKQDVEKDSPLWHWEGEDLHVHFYDKQGQDKTIALREAGQRGGSVKRTASNAVSHALSTAPSMPSSDATSHASSGMYVGRYVRKVGKEGVYVEDTHSLSPEDSEIPTLEEVRDWALGAAGVDPEYAARKWQEHTERKAWVVRGQLLDWRRRFKRFWEEDKVEWMAKTKNGAAARKPDDPDLWWEMPMESMTAMVACGSLNAQEATRAREIIRARGGQA